MPNILRYAHNSQSTQNYIFPSGGHIFRNSLMFKIQVIDCLIHYIKFEI